MSDRPNYRKASGRERCAICAKSYKVMCSGYQMCRATAHRVNPDHVCDLFSKRSTKPMEGRVT